MQINIPDHFCEELLAMLYRNYNELRNEEDLYVYKFQQAKRQCDEEDYAEILERIRDKHFELHLIIKQLEHEQNT